MENAEFLQSLEEEIVRLRKVRNLLAGVPAESAWGPSANGKPGKKHILSPEGRERIAAAQRRRWAANRLASQG